MSIEVQSAVPSATGPTRPAARSERQVAPAMRRGASAKCPACGKGALFSSYLKVVDHCASCGAAMHHQRADDAPPYFTMLIVGHVIVAGVLTVERAFAPPTWVHLVLWLPLTVLLSLWLLPRIKGALIGLQWALRMHGFGAGPDPAAVIEEAAMRPQTGNGAR